MTLLDLVLLLLVLLLAGLLVFRRKGEERAGEEAKRLLDAAREEGRAALEAARKEAREILEAARQEARLLREEAEARAKAFRQELEAEVRRKAEAAEAEAKKRLAEAEERLKAEREELRAERERLKALQEELKAERDRLKEEREELRREAERLSKRGEALDARALRLDALEEGLNRREEALKAKEAQLQEREKEVEARLHQVAGLSPEEARRLILERLDQELEEEKAQRVRAALEKVRLEARREAQKILAQAMQRQASETAAQLAVSVVPIPSDAMKGRIIGREGRNIRTFEALTGVDLIIDDTPEAVLLSSFNPIRREIARMALEELLKDGRIHPSRIEEVVEKAKQEMKTFIYERGEEAALEAGVVGLKPGLIQLLGRLHFRSSYGQNVLKHSVQVAHLTGIMAAELGLDAALARRAGLLHDIGKSVDREVEGSHVEIGIALARRFGEPVEVVDGIAHHHDPENAETVYAVLVAAADALSAARPGARRESLEEYLQRLEALERIALSFPGVETAFAVQAGREVRVIVKPEKITDAKATLLAREIAGRIEREMNYPGQVQVTVLRETRAVAYAR
ncbi:MAG: ribonuclease Y [Thermus sp.]|uniref:ribonuclease Y n=1 Tax=Thermus sp. TaxID=275 RepID=UPI0025DD071D|nr:ribonuclease Y [Thermus sp.]MCS6867919.1 ribonuclease Y [Thermus sp.]MCS7218828.1 ribonuclease Y [Thermus sp.]MCX7850401.1 ribonuclease Y [Thermus sp.]MDW8017597.1 ribonuclease Y [Thermus sp.]MDW8356624.1 ribonuclease Y [Thermus sp.]